MSVCVCLWVASVCMGCNGRDRCWPGRPLAGRCWLEMEGSSPWTRRRRQQVQVRGPLKSKQSRRDGGSGGKERWVKTLSAGGGVNEGRREGGGGGGDDGSEGGVEKERLRRGMITAASSSRVVMRRRRRMCGDGRGAARTHARYGILLALCWLASAERESKRIVCYAGSSLSLAAANK